AFRDLQHIMANMLTLWFFVTPVFYSLANVPLRFRTILIAGNPMAALVTSYQSIFYEHRLPDAAPLAVVGLESLILLWLAAAVFQRRREEFAELVWASSSPLVRSSSVTAASSFGRRPSGGITPR